MIKAAKGIAVLDGIRTKLDRVGDGEVVGFYVICPPDGSIITNIMDGTEPPAKDFYAYMISLISAAQKQAEQEGAGYQPYIGSARR